MATSFLGCGFCLGDSSQTVIAPRTRPAIAQRLLPAAASRVGLYVRRTTSELGTWEHHRRQLSRCPKQIYNRLIEFKAGTTELEPSLATKWTASEDSKTWTIKLREKVKFHDGTDFNALAVKFNVERWWDPKSLVTVTLGRAMRSGQIFLAVIKEVPNP